MSNNGYLNEYKKVNSKNLMRGFLGIVRSYLDRVAVSNGQKDRHALFFDRILKLLGAHNPSEPFRVLEIGCGSGWAIRYIHPSIKFVAIDLGDVYRDELEESGIEFHDMDASVDRLPLENRSVKIVMLNHLIEHMVRPEYMVGEIYRVLSDDGFLYVRTPNIERVKFSFWDDYTHVNPFTVKGLEHLMAASGFKLLQIRYSDHPRIMFDILTKGIFRSLVFSKLLGGDEIEAVYVRR